MKILITGASGLLGRYVAEEMSGSHEVLAVCNSNRIAGADFKTVTADLTDWRSLKDMFSSFRPEAIVHAAAISRPELCDKLPEKEVMNINAEVPSNIAGLASDLGAVLLFTSTDLVYDGNTGGMLDESGRIDPKSRYAESKVIAEEKVVSKGGRYLILRTSLLYGIGYGGTANNFQATLEKFRKGEKANLFNDQFRTPLALHDAAEMISKLTETGTSSAILNFGGKERISRVRLGEILCEAGGFDSVLINSISMNDADTVHKVADVSMNTEKLQSLGLMQRSVELSVKEILESEDSIRQEKLS
ncbi:MAG: SDR family oxidoreductase [Ignavibacteria bacterium]|nr:SDR family oxidoreductase [Ignavibacteria bacterium]